MTMEFRKTDKNISESNLKAVEDVLEQKLPESFKQFLLENNHGRPKEPVFDTAESKGRVMGALLNFNITKEHSDNFKDVYENLKPKLPKGFFPIATDPSGNYICAEIKDEAIVNICLWNHEAAFELSSSNEIQITEDSKNLEFIADNFQAFLDNLYIPR